MKWADGLCVMLKPHPQLNCLYLFKSLRLWPEILWNCKVFILLFQIPQIHYFRWQLKLTRSGMKMNVMK